MAQLDKLFDWVDASRVEEVYAEYGQSLGLLIARDWVNKQNAALDVYGEQARGTQFKAVFPLAPDVALLRAFKRDRVLQRFLPRPASSLRGAGNRQSHRMTGQAWPTLAPVRSSLC